MDQAKKDPSIIAPVIATFETEAADRVTKRSAQERRWLEDLLDYHGVYEKKFLQELEASQTSSKVFMNRTRRKTRAYGGRLKDMLFPTDDANWRIEPSEAPQLTKEAEQAIEAAMEAKKAVEETAKKDPETKELLVEAGAEKRHDEAQSYAEEMAAVLDEAEKRCEAMGREMADILTECRYEASARQAIDQAVKLGAGIVKGPMPMRRRRKGWAEGENGFELQHTGDRPERAEFVFADCWGVFPSPNALKIEDSEGVFERHLPNKTELKRMTRELGFDKDAVRRLMRDKSERPAPSYLTNLKTITGEEISTSDKFCVWEYSGPVEGDDLKKIVEYLGEDEFDIRDGEIDPLDEIHVVMWFCEGELLKIGPYPLDSDEPLYSFFVFEPDEASVWGQGVPRLGRTSQNVINGSWRGTMDNAGISLGPQIVIDPDQIEAADGSNEIRGPKLWIRKGPSTNGAAAIETFQIDMNLDQLQSLIVLGERYHDEETSLPQVAMGDSPEANVKTMGGMALQISQGAVQFREVVRRFDDEFTIPNITRLYDWQMQFSSDDRIKGDFAVKARGVSTLLMKEMESTNLMLVSQVYGTDDPDIKSDKIKRAVFRALSLDPDDLMRTKSEREAHIRELQEMQGLSDADVKMREFDLKEQELGTKVEIANMETASRKEAAQLNYEAAMVTLAEQRNMELDKLKALIYDKQQDRDSKERLIASEIAMSERESDAAAAQGREPNGSGGYVS